MADREDDLPEEQQALRTEARQKALDAAQAWWDSYAEDSDYDGALVTGYVLITEAVLPNGYPSIAWCSGNGQPPASTGITGSPAHRVDGMCRWVIREIYSDNAVSE